MANTTAGPKTMHLLLGCALALFGQVAVHAQNQFFLGTADYENSLYAFGPDLIPGITNSPQPTSMAFFNGSVGFVTNSIPSPGTSGDGVNYLVRSAFGQPVASTLLKSPDFLLGAEIVPPAGADVTTAPVIDPSVKAFYVSDIQKVFAGEPGFVTITWSAGTSNFPPQVYLISSVAVTNPAPVSIYLTDTNGTPTPAPPVDVGNLNVVLHPNSVITAAVMARVGNQLRATNTPGRIVIELRDLSNAFLGVQVVDVKSYQPDFTPNVAIGTFLAPQQTLPERIRPYVSLGLLNTGPQSTYYAYQYSSGANDPHDGDVFAVQPTTPNASQIEVFWFKRGLAGIIWPCEADRYQADWPADFGQTARRIYVTENDDGSATKAPAVTIPAGAAPNVTIHYNAVVPRTFSYLGVTNLTLSLQSNPRELHAVHSTGRILLHYSNPGNPSAGFIGFQLVDIRSYFPDFTDDWHVAPPYWYLGDQLQPTAAYADTNAPKPLVARGLAPDTPVFAYQHVSSDQNNPSPMEGYVFAIRQTDRTDEIEVFWKRHGLQNVEWPYEMHRYTATWPTNVPSKYQLYVRGTLPALGPGVDVLPSLNAQLQAYQDPPLHATLANNTFYSTQPGWSLLRYTPTNSNIVQFQVVRSIWHDDTSFTNVNLSLQSWDIGSEIINAYHQGPKPGYVYVPAANPHAWDRYDPDIYSGTNGTGQIFAVNKGAMEVWWFNTNRNVQWPSLVQRYTNSWPAQPGRIVIASQQGTGPLDPTTHQNITPFYQNDPSLPGFNPNDEHVLVSPIDSAFFALRDDLGTAATSDPYVLLKYQDPANGGRWQFLIYQVMAEGQSWDGINYTFNYPATAGTLIQEPAPLSLLDVPPSPESSYVAGPAWRDRKLFHWAKAAGDDGGATNIVMRYFYQVQNGFYFPDTYLGTFPPGVPRTNVPPAGSRFAWLDLHAGTPGTPQDITYAVRWPTQAPTLRVGETLVKSKFGLPDIASMISAEILYQQAQATGGVQSVKLIDPTQEVGVDLAAPPIDAQIALGPGGVKYFPQLPPQLRNRVWYDSARTSKQLRFKGVFVDTPSGINEPKGYLLLNVLTAREYARLRALSPSGDPAYLTALNTLSNLAARAVEVPPNTPFDSLALTAGQARGQGYVTFAENNSTNLNQPADPIKLHVIQVACPTYDGDIEVIESDNPFDEKLTLRHSGDFAGKGDDYIFEWRRLPPADGLPPPINPPDAWIEYVAPSVGAGVVDITIEGPGLVTLSDNYFICRYRPKSSPLCGAGADPNDPSGWSNWILSPVAEGWIKRVLTKINPFEQRFSNYTNTTVNTIVSMIQQAGPRWTGDVPFNASAANNFGLIEIYETVLERGRQLSIDGSPPVNYGPANDALLFAAGRIADLYMLLGNEAYADAVDPTVAFGNETQQYAAVASSIFCFMNQEPSLVQEELALLRGRDNSLQPPVQTAPFYNRLIWNFTHGINGGEVAYQVNYGITDVNGDGVIDGTDASLMYPQGHGDAWGHYLTATMNYYRLLRSTNFTWVPRIEAVLVGNSSVSVDYLDERKFAKAAAARARTGAEIVNLTYRNAYVEDPNGQWQGYQDSNTNRAWGLSEWGCRAGQGAYFDWIVGNAILPAVDSNPAHAGIQKIDRATVLELRDIPSAAHDIQAQEDNADLGLNPLGLAKDVVPFDIDPNLLSQAGGPTHFEQIYGRAVQALNNAISVFDNAENSTQELRKQADTVTDFQQKVTQQETDYTNRLIEIFGYPYPEDIGPIGTYPSGYQGPDTENLHFNYIDYSDFAGVPPPTAGITMQNLVSLTVDTSGALISQTNSVPLSIATDGLQFVKPPGWSKRLAPGEIQRALGDLLQARTRFFKGQQEYDNLIGQIEDQANLLQEQYAINASDIQILNDGRNTQSDLNSQIQTSRATQLAFRAAGQVAVLVADAVAEALPTDVGFSVDATAPVRGAIKLAGSAVAEEANLGADVESLVELSVQQAKEDAQAANNIRLAVTNQALGIASQIAQLQQLVRQEPLQRTELYTLQEAIVQAAENYRSVLTKGERLLADRAQFRAQTAAQIQQYRYKDMAFRIFRDDALQKYRAQFDLAARYVYLAARAYDFETCLLPGDARGPGQNFMTDIVRAQAIGLIQNGQPVTGSGTGDAGLADPLARMYQNWNLVLKGQLGFNNPETETGRFSLRSELFRVQTNATTAVANQVWREVLSRSVVSNILALPEFQRYCIPFSPALPAEPGIVIPFSTTITFGQNYFGWPLGGGDNAYDSSHFATKVRSAGVWFANYNSSGLSQTPYVYLVPVGNDVCRAPGGGGATREWKVLDQVLPVPYVNPGALTDPNWIPIDSMLGGQLADIRKFASLQAYNDGGTFNPGQTTSSSRLIGRSVWNTRWLLVIPAGTLLADRNEALQRFINGNLLPNGTRDGNGISDIKIFFQTYSYAGN